MDIRWPLLVRRIHKWLALFVGLQALIWTASGMYMVAVHIDYIHGDHLVRPATPRPQALAALAPPSSVLAEVPTAREVRLTNFLNRPVWRATTPEGSRLFDARTGSPMPSPTKEQIEQLARSIYTGDPTIVSTKLLAVAPLEMQTRKPPYWQVEFKGWNRPTLYLSPTTGELVSRRHDLWRVFDVAWMLHIMDYSERQNVNNPLLRVATWSAVLMALAGALLLIWSFPRKKKKKLA